MISEGSCDTEDWSDDYIFKYIKIENNNKIIIFTILLFIYCIFDSLL